MKHIICYSGGHSSALVALEVVRRYGKDNVILLNHDINDKKELPDVKRFKIEIAAYLELPITYCNYKGISDNSKIPNQFDIVKRIGAFKKPRSNKALCTHFLKTKPFEDWLLANYPLSDTLFRPTSPVIIYYGFDKQEENRILRRSSILAGKGYKTAFPLANWNRTILNTNEIGINPPQQYSHYKHANCIGCLKGGIQHWYTTYIHHIEVFREAIKTENEIGYSILKRRNQACYLEELEPIFERMKNIKIEASEYLPIGEFKKALKACDYYEDTKDIEDNVKPCECIF